MRLGMGLFYTRGLARVDSVREAGRQAVPVMAASAVLFILAAITEGFLSPSSAPYLIKVAWSILSSAMITLYFVILGFPRGDRDGASLVRTARYADLIDSPETTKGGDGDAT